MGARRHSPFLAGGGFSIILLLLHCIIDKQMLLQMLYLPYREPKNAMKAVLRAAKNVVNQRSDNPNFYCYFAILKPDNTAGREISFASTLETDARGGPCHNCSSISETACSGPAIKAVTAPSGSLRTQPARPSRCAWPRVQMRKLTPCTLPVTRTNTALWSFMTVTQKILAF
jgi:hypothetical protein